MFLFSLSCDQLGIDWSKQLGGLIYFSLTHLCVHLGSMINTASATEFPIKRRKCNSIELIARFNYFFFLSLHTNTPQLYIQLSIINNIILCLGFVFMAFQMSFFRMIPASYKLFQLSDLASARDYDLCVLAVYDDGVTALTATRLVGCVSFSTEREYHHCRSLHDQFLGGTMIIVIGGIIVASVLVFIFILLMKYKLHSQHYKQKAERVSNVCSQTNGGQQGAASNPPPPRSSSSSASASKPSILLNQERPESYGAQEGGYGALKGTTVVDLNPEYGKSVREDDSVSQ